MSLTKRIIPCLDVDNGRVVKGVNFLNIRDAGAPKEIAQKYDKEGADELTMLDITASSSNRETTYKTIEEIDALAISIGPGSFTGLRIGLGFCKGLAYSKGLPIIPVPTMLSLAFALKDREPKNGILHSHSKKVFYQGFDWENNLPKMKDKAVVNNIDKYLDGREIGFHSNCGNFFNADDSIQEVIHSARHIGLLASLFFDEWIIHKPYGLVPEYIAPFKIKRSV